jgi:hypothetical protein
MIDNWFAEHGIVTYYEKAIYLDSIRIVPDWYIPSFNLSSRTSVTRNRLNLLKILK